MIRQAGIEKEISDIYSESISELLHIGFKSFNMDLVESYLEDASSKSVKKIPLQREKNRELSDVDLGEDMYDILHLDISSSTENRFNFIRQENLRNQFNNELIHCLQEEDFEFGYTSRSELIIREQLKINELVTRNWLNELFINYFHNETIIIGLLRVIGRFEESIIFPQGQTMALSALVHRNDEIKELGIRAFENWNSRNSLNVLENVKASSKWLEDYLNQVISDLKEELCLY